MNGSTIKNKGPLFVLKPASERFEVRTRYLFIISLPQYLLVIIRSAAVFFLNGGFPSDPNEPRIFNLTKP